MENIRAVFETSGGVRPSKTRVLQLGGSDILRALIDVCLDQANERLGLDLGVAAVMPLDRAPARALAAQDGLYTALLCGAGDGRAVREAHTVKCLRAPLDPRADFAAVLSLAGESTLALILTDAAGLGLPFNSEGAYADAPQASLAGLLTRFLHERFLRGQAGCVLLACDALAHNGAALEEAIVKTAVRWRLGGGFMEWLLSKNAFCSTLAERAALSPAPEAEGAAADYTDGALLWAESFGQWVIQAPPAVRKALALDQAGCPVVFTDDIAPYYACKARLWDGAQAALAPAAFLSGLDCFTDCMNDESARAFLARMLVNELVPYAPLAREQALRWAAQTCARLENPCAPRPLLAAAAHGAGKYAALVLPALCDYAREKRALPPCLCFGLSALIMLMAGARQNADGTYTGLREGVPYPVTDSAYALEAFSRMSCDMPPESLAYAALSDCELWGSDLRAIPDLEDIIASQLRDIQLLGIKEAMRAAWEAQGGA